MIRTIRTSLLGILLCLGSWSVFAQIRLAGKVTNQDGETIPYCSIGVRHTHIGALADGQGRFVLMLADSLANAKLVFSAVGYQDTTVTPVKTAPEWIVVLKPQVRLLEEVAVSAKRYRHKIVGERKRPFLTFSRMVDERRPTVEQGCVLVMPPKAWLTSFRFFIMPSSRYTRVSLKLNVYDAPNGLPQNPLPMEPIIYRTTTTGWQTIDLAAYKLRATPSGKVALTLQLVDFTPPAPGDFLFGLSAKKTLAPNMLLRYQSQGDWQKQPGTFIANVAISYPNDAKGGKAEHPSPEFLDETDRVMAQVYRSHQEASQTRYGHDKAGTYVDLGDTKLYYESYGQGEPLVLLHGNKGSIADFYGQIPVLAQHYRVIAIDTRGQGRSTNLSTLDYTYDLFARDLNKLLTHLQLSKVHILGWSDGGNTGLAFSRSYPQQVNKLITIGANMFPAGIKEETRELLRDQFKRDSVSQDTRLLNLMLTQPQLTADDLARINTPVLVIAGQNDVILESHTKQMQQLLPNARLVIMADASHYLPFEQPQKLNSLILSFLAR
jgi:pimeloyl-ACP methyl ester carboxylesterase